MIQTNGGNQLIGARQQYAVTPVTVDLATAPLLPYVSTTTFAPTGVSWAEQGTGTADFVLARLDVTPITAPAYTRVIIAPHNGMSLPLPLLQGADATYNPSAADQIAGTHAIGKAVGGYDAARARAFAVTSFAQTAPMNGTVTLSYAGNAPTLGPN